MKPNTIWAGATATGLSMTAAEATELRMLAAFPEPFAFTREIGLPFMDLVAQETGGDGTVSLTGPDAVPALELLEPVQAGAFDMLFTHPACHAGTTTVGLAIDAIATDPKPWAMCGEGRIPSLSGQKDDVRLGLSPDLRRSWCEGPVRAGNRRGHVAGGKLTFAVMQRNESLRTETGCSRWFPARRRRKGAGTSRRI